MSTKETQFQDDSEIELDGQKLSAAIRTKREQAGLSLRGLASVIGVSAPTLSRLENAKDRPTTENLLAVCRWLGKAPENFYNVVHGSLGMHKHYLARVNAGPPGNVPQESDYLNLVAALTPDPDEYFSVYVHGDSMIDALIFPGDLLIARASKTANPGDIVIAEVNDDFCVKRYEPQKNGSVMLRSANPEHKDILVSKEDVFKIRGIVMHSIHQHKRGSSKSVRL